MRAPSRLVVAVGLAGLLAGCSTVALQGTHIEPPAPAGAGARGPAPLRRIVVEGLEITFHPGDVVRAEAAPPPLRLRLAFEPPAIGYAFNPGEVVLRAADGREWAPRVSGPGRFERGVCRWPGGEPPSTARSPFRVLTRGSCLELEFDVAVPEGQMELFLNGLARGRRRLEPVRVHVAHRCWRSIDRMYWLEALEVAGYLLAHVH